jgi:demethylmenaquinone methyltransferase/2-methoxy-6-polyprenyl-1,4-benzoquinol methylase
MPEAAATPQATTTPEAGTLQAGEVRAMFDRIARIYDPLNTAMTAGLHHRWRERAVDLARVGPGARVLDVAAGTGDLTLALARRIGPGGEVRGSDFSEKMLAIGRAKAARAAPPGVDVRFEWADALALPYDEDSFDAATVGFGARNFSDLPRGLAELVRVVRPGGRVVVLELARPLRPPLSLFCGLWFERIVPVLGRLSGGSDAYTYLPNSVKRWPPPAALAAEFERAGLADIGYLLLSGGIVSIHAATVPAGGAVPAGGTARAGDTVPAGGA